MRLRLTSIDELQLLTCLKYGLWGAPINRFKDWRAGDRLIFVVDKALAALAEVSGDYFTSEEPVWSNGVFPHRIPIRFHLFIPLEERPPILGELRDTLIAAFGNKYGFGMITQQPLPEVEQVNTVLKIIKSRNNALSKTIEELDQKMADAEQLRKSELEKSKRTKKKTATVTTENIPIEEEAQTPKELGLHSNAQSLLIELGKATGCEVWVATNDKNRECDGKNLGEGCLKSFPSLGLSSEAIKRISYIDVIWIKQRVPVYAFEVEATTSIYSGLLRMSDLLAVVPALKIKLFIVAPKERQGKVMDELARPTFEKIGLSDFCGFISIEDLDALLRKVRGIAGYVQSSVVDTIATSYDDDDMPTY